MPHSVTMPLLVLLFVLMLGSGRALAQSGAVHGVVTDEQEGEPLAGAAVLIQGTSIGAVTALDGVYRIARAPTGEQTLVVSYLGYRTEQVSVVVEARQSIRVDVRLGADIIQGEEVIVTAQAEGQMAAINQQLASNTIVNVVSAARIQELPDANAAESVGRLPGISILRDAGEGHKVVVRGLSPKYNAITVNGERVPGTDLDDRSVDLSMIAPDMLAGIEVFKALTPDMNADAIGGIVNFTFRGAPSTLHYDLRMQTGYNAEQSSYGQYKGSASISNRFIGGRMGLLATANVERADRGSDVFSAGYSVKREALEGEERAPIGIGSVTLRDRLENRNRYGASIVLDYDLPGGRIFMTNFASGLDRDELVREKQYSVSSFRTRYNLRERDIFVSILSNSLRGEHRVAGADFEWSLSRSASLQKIPYDNRLQFHELAAFNDAILEDERGPEFVPVAAKNTLENTFLYDAQFGTGRGRERDYAGQADLRIPLALSRQVSGYVKTGGKYRSTLRSRDGSLKLRRFDLGGDHSPQHVIAAFPERDLQLSGNGFVTINNFLETGYNPGEFLDGQYEFGAVLDRGVLTDLYDRLGETYRRSIFADLADYEFGEDVGAGYVMAEVNITPRLMILPGIRYEHTWTEFDAKQGIETGLGEEQGIVTDTTSSADYGLWFPMFHVRYHLTSWFDIRLARTRTLSRPEFLFLSPSQRISAESRVVRRGTPGLRPVKSTNHDVFLSFHANRLGLLTVGGFYKELDDLVYQRSKTVLSPTEENVPRAARGFSLEEPVNNENVTTVKGFEVEWQTHFTYLPRPFDGIVLNFNFSRIYSDTQYPRVILVRQTQPPFGFTQVDTFRTGPMPNQADHIVNVSIGYDKGGFSGRISMLYQGRSLSGVGDRSEVDGFTDTYVRWDASLLQSISGGLSVFLNVNNLTDRPDLSYQATARFPTAQEFYGWTADVGLRYRF